MLRVPVEQKTILEAMPDLALITDARGRVVFCNQAARERFALGNQAVPLEQLFVDGLPPVSEWTSPSRSAQLQGLALSGNGERFLAELRLFPLGADGTYLALIREARSHAEVDEKLQVERRLRDSEEKYRAIVEEGHDPIFLFDVETGEILDCNHRAERMLLERREGLVGQKIQAFLPEENLKIFEARLNRLRDTGRGFQIGDSVIRRKTGREQNVHFSISSLQLAGRRVGLVMVRDISMEKRFRTQQLYLAKVDAIAKLALTTAQQINEPATALQAHLSQLREDLKRSKQPHVAQRLDTALAEVGRIREIALMMGVLDRYRSPEAVEGEDDRLNFNKISNSEVLGEVNALREEVRRIQNVLTALRNAASENSPGAPSLEQVESEFSVLSEKMFQYLQRMTDMAVTDPLTGLYNRRFLEEEVKREYYRTIRFGRPLGFLYVDVDNFKPINDRYGHDAGDRVLSTVGRRLRRCTRKSDVSCRYGGDEFVLLLQASTERSLRTTAVNMKEALENDSYRLGGDRSVQLTVSIGGFLFNGENAAAWEEIILKADQALLHAREAGKSQIRIVT